MRSKNRQRSILFVVVMITSTLLVACATPTPEVMQVEVTRIVQGTAETVVEEVLVTPTPEPPPTPITEPVHGGTLHFGMPQDLTGFDPHSRGWSIFPMRDQLYDPLIRYDHELNPHPWLAESWELSDDGLTVTLELRKGVKFHNGREMVAEDILKNLEKAQDPERCAHQCSATKNIESYEAPDDYTVVIHYSTIDTGWQDFIEDLFIIAPEAFDTLKDAPIGTGPFKFKEWIPNDHATFVKNEDYWGDEGPYLDEIVFHPYGTTDVEAMLAAFQTGALDLIIDIPWKDVRWMGREYTTYMGQPGSTIQCLYMNPNKIKDKRIRQAVAYAFDREAAREVAYGGTGGDFYYGPYPKTSWAYNEEFEGYYDYDLEKARALVEEAGAEGTTLVFQCFRQDHIDEATILRDSLKEIGINLEIQYIERTVWLDKYYNYDLDGIYSGGISNTNKDPARCFVNTRYQVAPASPMIAPDAFWPVHPETGETYAELIDQGSSILDQERRTEIYNKLQEIVLDEAWTICWQTRVRPTAVQPYVHGFDWRVDSGHVLQNVWLEPH